METRDIRFTVDGHEYTMDAFWGRAEFVIHTPGGDITANWEEGEGFYGVKGLSGLDDDWNGPIDAVLREAEKVLEALTTQG